MRGAGAQSAETLVADLHSRGYSNPDNQGKTVILRSNRLTRKVKPAFESVPEKRPIGPGLQVFERERYGGKYYRQRHPVVLVTQKNRCGKEKISMKAGLTIEELAAEIMRQRV